MLDNGDANEAPSQNGGRESSAAEFLASAVEACDNGDTVLAMYLYLAAYEKTARSSRFVDSSALRALRCAWDLACALKERSMAEYVFEKLEPYLAPDELQVYAEQLQRLALDKLEEFGLTREDIEDMADMISQDFLDGDAPYLQVEHISLPRFSPKGPARSADFAVLPGGRVHADCSAAPAPAADVAVEAAAPAAAPAAAAPAADIAVEAAASTAASAADAAFGDISDQGEPADSDALVKIGDDLMVPNVLAATPAGPHASSATLPDMPPAASDVLEPLSMTYRDLAGYDRALASMHALGVGVRDDPQFDDLVAQLNRNHGLDRMPALDSLLFVSPAREDAGRFVQATVGELGLPCVRMIMEENLQGMPVLCVMAPNDGRLRIGRVHGGFGEPAVLVLEDLDLWIPPVPADERSEGIGGFVAANLSRGAREAVNLIRAAVEDPDVYVLVSAENAADVDPFFSDLLAPLSVVEIEHPTADERAAIWEELAREHPSLQDIDRDALVRYSAGMPRFDLYMAAREAVEEAYKGSLISRRYLPVSVQNLFEKLAAYQPLDSREYHELEERVVDDFRRGLDQLGGLLGPAGE